MSTTLSPDAYSAYVQKHANWNFWVNTLDLTFYTFAVSFVFGSTVLDQHLAREWQAVLQKMESARRTGVRFIFCCRDYILRDAEDVLRMTTIGVFKDNSVYIEVDELTHREREQILYNHIKHGDLPSATKTLLKPHLASVAELSNLTPEISRRLGNDRFHSGLKISQSGLRRFVDEPVTFFQEVFNDRFIQFSIFTFNAQFNFFI